MKTLLGLCLLVSLSSCSPTRQQEVAEITDAINTDYFTEKVSIQYAENFKVSYHHNYKIVKAKVDFGTAAQDSDSASWTKAFSDVMVLVQKGTPIPPLTGELKDAHVIEIPVNTVAGNSDDAPTRFIALEVTDRLLGLGHENIYDSLLRERFVQDELKVIGASWHTGPNLEILATIKPEVTILTAASLTQAEGIERTRQLKLKAAPDFSWSERSYLGQLEWIKYDALFLNAERQANAFFDKIKTRCDSLSRLVDERTDKPGALWASHSRSGSWIVRSNGGIAQLMQKAGAVNIFEDGKAAITETRANGLSEGIQIPDEQVLQKAKEVDFIISFQATTENWPPESYMSAFPAYEKDQMYHHFKRFKDYGASDWYQTASMRPDLLLSDMIKLFYPDLLPGHQLFFLEPLKKVN